MKAKILLAALLAAATLAGTAHAGFISILGEDGQVWNLDTSTREATKTVKFPDPSGSAEGQYSPNALGVSGSSYFYTSFNTSQTINETLYRNGNLILNFAVGQNFNIANGDADGNNFYFVDRHTGYLSTIADISGSPTSSDITTGTNKYFIPNSNSKMGDIAVNGTTAYLSYDESLAVINLSDPTAAFTKSVTQNRYVGLGFDGDNLYGVRRAGDNNFDLYRIDTSTLGATLVGDITGVSGTGAIDGKYEITDASRAVPIPAAVWLLGTGIVGLAALRRKLQK